MGLNVDSLISASALAHHAMTAFRRCARRRMGESSRIVGLSHRRAFDLGPRPKSLGDIGESGLLSVADLHASDAEETAL